jgi:hypothetical protein
VLHLRHFIALALAALLVFAAATAASGNNLSINEREFELVWGSLTLTFNVGTTVSCPTTLLGHDHNVSFVKSIGQLIGFIDHVQRGRCTGGTATPVESSLPWHETYEGFTGTLPNITSINILIAGMSAQITTLVLGLSITCQATTTGAENLTVALNIAGGRVTSTTASSGTIDTVDVGGGTNCDSLGITMRISGNGAKTTLGGAAISVRLI